MSINNASVYQRTQVGVETTPGTSVAADKRLQSLSIEPAIQSNIQMFTPAGNKLATVQALNQEWTSANVTGQPTYDEMLYALASLLGEPVSTTGTEATSHAFTINPSSADTPATFTVETGSPTYANRFTHALMQSMNLNISRTGIDLSGTMLGQLFETDITLTSSPTTDPLVPILPGDVSVYVDDTAAGLGTTKLTRAFQANLSVPAKYNPLWVLDASHASWASYVEAELPITLALTVQMDATGMAFLDNMREGSSAFIRVEAIGPEVATGEDYEFSYDLSGKVSAISTFEDREGVYAVTWTFQVVDDTTGFDAVLQNSLSGLS